MAHKTKWNVMNNMAIQYYYNIKKLSRCAIKLSTICRFSYLNATCYASTHSMLVHRDQFSPKSNESSYWVSNSGEVEKFEAISKTSSSFTSALCLIYIAAFHELQLHIRLPFLKILSTLTVDTSIFIRHRLLAKT